MNFISGLKLSESFFFEIVRPLLKNHYPFLQYAAALIGTGSEVQGFDDGTSCDHHWGVRLLIFLTKQDLSRYESELHQFFRKKLPYEFRGISTNWTLPDPFDGNNQFPQPISEGEVNHRIEIHTVQNFLLHNLGIKIPNLSDIDWLLLPEQRLREFTSGKVFEDTIGELTKTREELSYFPSNVWMYKLLSQWNKIAEEMPFPGRIGMQGDNFGAIIETTRLIRYAMVLCFILEKQYVPYPKWFSKAFTELHIASEIIPLMEKAITTYDFKKRDEYLCKIYLTILKYQNSLGITKLIELSPQPFHSRPITVVDVDKILKSFRKKISSPLKTIKYPMGSIDQLIDYPNILSDAQFFKKIRPLYEEQ